MHEPLEENRMSKTQWKAPHYGAGAGLLVVGLIAGRAFFPLEIPKPFVVEKEKRIEVPVERVVVQKEPFEVIRYVDRVVEKRVEVPVEKIVGKMVEVPVERIVYRDIAVGVDGVRSNVYWRTLSKGQSKSQVIAALGHPVRIRNGPFEEWYYSDRFASASVTFLNDRLYSWNEP